jgi:hypothetical protein
MRAATILLVASASVTLGAPTPGVMDWFLGGLLTKIKAVAGKCVIIKNGGQGTVVPRPPTPVEMSQCLCPTDKFGDVGSHINEGNDWYQCAYPHGACTWNDVSTKTNQIYLVLNLCHSMENCKTHSRRIVPLLLPALWRHLIKVSRLHNANNA